MLSFFRKIAKSPVAVVLFVVLGLSFVGWQVGGRINGGGARLPKDAVVSAGSRTVGSAQFKRIFDGYLQQIGQQQAQQGQPPPTLQDAVSAGIDRRVAESMGDDLAMAVWLDKLDVRASDRQVVGEIRKSPAFFDQVTGSFDAKAYRERLAGAGLTVAEFEGSIRDELAQSHAIAGLVAGLRAPRIYPAVERAFLREGRSFSYFAVPASIAGPPVQPTDAQLQQFLNSHAAQLMRPALRTLTLVRFSTAAVAPTITAAPADVEKRFAFEKDSLSTAEKRTFVQVSAKDAAGAAKAAGGLRAGVDPAKIAQASGGQVIPYLNSPKTAVADKRVADAAFALKPGEVSAPIQGELGWAVVKLAAVALGHEATLAEARPKLEAEVKKDAAQKKVYDQAQKFEDIRAGGANVAIAAKQVGATPETVGPVTEQGQTAQGPLPTPLPPKVLAAAFKLPQGGESELIDLGAGEYAVVRVEKVQPPAPPPLEEIRAPLTHYVVLQEAVKKVRAKADELAAAVRKGQPVDAAARTIAATPGQGVGVLRDAGGQTFSREFLGQVFSAKTGDVVVGEDVKLGFVVAKLTAISAPTPADAASGVEALRSNVGKNLFEDLSLAIRAAVRNKIKPAVDAKRARDALGASAQPAAGGAAS